MLALFDLDDTLVDRRGGLAVWALGFARSRGLPAGSESVIRERLGDRARPEDFVHVRALLGLEDPPEALWREYVAGMARSARCFPGVREGLDALRSAGWVLGVATNGPGDIQRAKLAASDLLSHFHGICVSEEIGVRKPAPEHFETAAALCGRKFDAECWMVGDNPETDIEGAQAAGLRTAWVANGRTWAGYGREPDIVAPGVAEAIAMMRQTGS
ncbi:HAD family hydrolase [Streptomyces triticagri]|uniref:HAD family hydrolase n=1 Tax=Streptomyces triticagri TaxID=2293568 RepID=A0A372LX48_9ACTN|nr:HAD family hydrolase [Streptomyces triticagri]RFU82875.1 HAD family hydrolase [Streptomyces triticagri]